MNSRSLSLLWLILLGSLFVGSAMADTLSDAKARMRERVPAIDRLKLSEAIGENNRGYLEVRKAASGAGQTASAENADRDVVFIETARRSGSSADAVGREFARQIAAGSRPGVWLQDPSGRWYKK
ncbi:MAG: DUF1318 domain-containing protein [Opitutaceae bacterium]|nr:DUF1318 domain-containing protein [Opitutaceae bacterium]